VQTLCEDRLLGLLVALKKERGKVQRLKPNRYCIATSAPLSPANKREIREIFHPFCRSDADIFGREDLNNFLTMYPDIEKQHYKLWLTSSVIMERIVHSDVYNQTAALVEAIQAKAKLYVQNQSFFDALDILREHKYCVISGIPGIGKSFLAEVLLLEYVRQGFEPVVVRSHIREAFRILKAGTRQVFYYDDFLGQTGWEDKLEKNEEQTILDFIAYVRRHEHAVFILTTREYILQQARNVYEKLHSADFDHEKCIIKLASYTRRNKAHILFNHVFFSDLPDDHRQALIRREYLLKIVDHANYSPRIVEWMSGIANVREYSAKQYPKFFLDTLNDPAMLWQHAYRNHLTPAARSLLLALYSFHAGVDLDDLREAFEAFRLQEVRVYGVARTANEFESALDELEGSFVRCERNSKSVVVSFHNPSVRDFLERHLATNSEQADILCDSLVFYDQFRTVFTPQAARHQRTPVRLGGGAGGEAIVNAALRTVSRTAKRHVLRTKADGTAMVLPLVATTFELNATHALHMTKDLSPQQAVAIGDEILQREKKRLETGKAVLSDLPKLVAASAHISEVKAAWEELVSTAVATYDQLELYEELDDIVALKDFIKVVPGAVPETLIQRVRQTLEEQGYEIFDWKISSADDEIELETIEETVADLEEVFDVPLVGISEEIEEQKEEIQRLGTEPPDDWFDREPVEAGDAGDNEIVEMFGSMVQ